MTTAATEIKLIQIGRRALGLDETTYRAMLANLAGGKTSSTLLTAEERQTVLRHLKAKGFVVKPKDTSASAMNGWQREPQMRKLRAMWYVLADAGHVERPADMAACNDAIEAWGKVQLLGSPVGRLDKLRFANGAQMDKLIEQMKRWLARLKLPTD